MARQFTDVLAGMNAGRTVDNLTEKLAEVTNAVLQTGKKGTLTLKIEVSKNSEHSVSLNENVDIKVPELSRGTAVYFKNNNGDLMRDDPRQPRLPLRRVGEDTNAADHEADDAPETKTEEVTHAGT